MRKLFLIAGIIIAFVVSAGAQQSWYVSEKGNDDNPGSVDQPFRTVMAAVGKVGEGDTIYLREGVYREKIYIDKDGLVLCNYPGEAPVIKGSVVMNNWELRGSYWKKYVEEMPQQVFVDGNHPLQQIGYPNDWFKNHTGYSVFNNPVGEDINDMAPGRFWWESDTLYIWLEDSGDPNDHQIEVSQYQYILSAYAAQDITLKGITFEHSNGLTHDNQAAAIILGNRCVIDSCIVQWTDFGGIATGYHRSGGKILNSQALHNGAVGIESSESYNFLIKNCRMAYNNYRNFYSQWHTGGYKGATYSYGTIEDCEVDHNNGPGVWFDYCMHSGKYDVNDGDNLYPIIVRNNYFHHNGTGNYDPGSINNNASILIEVSEQAFVYNNVIDTFEYRGIWISGSYFTTVTNNLITHGTGKYALDAGAIYAASPPAYLRYNRIVNNLIFDNQTTYDLRMKPEDGTVVLRNICRNNLIYRPGTSIHLQYGSTNYSSLDNWKSNTPYGENSVEADPLFSDEEFHLSDQSPCINTGYNLLEDTMLVDFDGNDRIMGPLIDIGAMEATVGATDAYNAVLQSLDADNGTLDPVFQPDCFVYYDTLPDNTSTTPVVTAVPEYSGTVVSIEDATDVMSEEEADRTTVVTTVSENNLITYRYKVIFYSKNTTDVDDMTSGLWLVYPNPVGEKLFLETGGQTGSYRLMIMDLTGRKIMEKRGNTSGTVEMNVSGVQEGVYLLRFQCDEKVRTFRIRVAR